MLTIRETGMGGAVLKMGNKLVHLTRCADCGMWINITPGLTPAEQGALKENGIDPNFFDPGKAALAVCEDCYWTTDSRVGGSFVFVGEDR